MKVIEKKEDGSVVLELTQFEKMVITNIGNEFTSGSYRLSNWDEPLFHCSREEAAKIFQGLFDATSSATKAQD